MGFGYIENASKQITKLRDRVALLYHLEWIFANYRAGRRRRTAVTLGPRWPLLSHPFVLYIVKTWPPSNLMSFLSKILKNLKTNLGLNLGPGSRGGRWGWTAVTLGPRWPH